MLKAKKNHNLWYASSLQVQQNFVNISFSLQHLSPDLPRRDLDNKFFVVRGADEYTVQGTQKVIYQLCRMEQAMQ